MRHPSFELGDATIDTSEFEEAVYGPVLSSFLRTFPDDHDFDYEYRRISMGPWCANTSRSAHEYLSKTIGLTGLKLESHSRGMQHMFVSFGANESEIRMDDTIVDPTYLQFTRNFNPQKIQDERPLFFTGTRAAIVQLMNDTSFTRDENASSLYLAPSLDGLYTRLDLRET